MSTLRGSAISMVLAAFMVAGCDCGFSFSEFTSSPSVEEVEEQPEAVVEGDDTAFGEVKKAKAKVRKVAAPKPAGKEGGSKSLGWLEDADLKFVAFGEQDGKGTAIVEGRLLQAGTVVGDYVVVSIDEEAVHLKEADGPGTRMKRFVLEPEIGDWQRD